MTSPTEVSAAVLQFDEVCKVFPGTGKRPDFVAIERLHQEVQRGEFVVVVGPSGCGKSTLLEIAAGLQPVSSGTVRLNGKPVTGPSPEMGVVFQEDSLFPWRTALENMEFGLEVRGVPKAERRERCREILDIVGLSQFADNHPRQLSGGMRQRVAIGRALALDPDVLFMDEPFGALDQQTRYRLGEELLRVRAATNKTIFFVTHDINEAVLLGDRVWILSKSPATLQEELIVDLPRPRGVHTLATPRFHELTSRVWELLSAVQPELDDVPPEVH